MPSQSHRPSSTEEVATSTTTTETSTSTTNNDSRPAYEFLWDRWFGSSNDNQVVEEVTPAPQEVDNAIEAAVADVDNASEMGDMLSAAEDELTSSQAYKLEEDMYVTAEKGGEKVSLAAGSQYTVKSEDLPSWGDQWKNIARNFGTTPEKLAAFNGDVDLAEGVQIYVPSAEERLFAEYRKKYSYDEAITEFYKAKQGPSVQVYASASERASGKVGESYGTKGVDGGKFMTPNPELAGASSKRSEQVNGHTEYKVFWVQDFWKCSIFMNDAVFMGGYKPALMENKHYSTAGRAHQSTVYKEVGVKDARPGDAWQRFGGTGSDESHNAILSSFVDVKSNSYSPDVETWEFKIIGAESDRAAESEQSKTMKRGTNEMTDGKKIRFLRPQQKR